MSIVYFVQVAPDGPIKIGTTTSSTPAYRLRILQTGSPYPLKSLGSVRGTQQHEQSLHRRFARFRLNGEWFEPSPVVLQAINEILQPGYIWPDIETNALATNAVHQRFLDAIEAFLVRTNLSATTFGKLSVGDPNFVGDLRRGRMPNLGLVQRVNDFMNCDRAAA